MTYFKANLFTISDCLWNYFMVL